MLKKVKYYFPEIFVFLLSFSTRFVNLGNPPKLIFDEVYHAFTAQQMFRGNPASWEWWNTPPPGVAYEWTHPPLAKEFMVLAISLFGDNAFAWRFFSALFGFGAVILVYLITRLLFKNRKIAIFSALAFSLNGLSLVMSRIAMNDSYFVFFSLLAIFFFLRNRKFSMSVSLGLAIASKWTGFFTVAIILCLYIFKYLLNKKRYSILKFSVLQPLFLLFTPFIIYLLIYLPFFLVKHSPPYDKWSNVQTFIELQKQMWWYHTNLKASHPYQSTPIKWIFDLRPVWLYVDYKPGSIANIYTLGNPLFMWAGIISIIFIFWKFIKKYTFSLGLVLIAYFGFFIPWIYSPRIMLNYHYLPSVPFLAIAIGFTLNQISKGKYGKVFVVLFFIILFLLFIYFYPLWVGVHVPQSLYNSYFWLKSWK